MRRLAHCGRFLTGDFTRVHVKAGSAYYCDVQTCGSVWICPVCSASIRQRRALEVERVALAHLENGNGVGFLTLTFPHSRGDELRSMLRTLTKCWDRVKGATSYRRLAGDLALLGDIRATEITYGSWHGWHPHLHVLLFADRPVSDVEWQQLRDLVSELWARAVVRAGRDRPGEVVGVTLAPVRSAEVGRYVAKVQDHYGEASSIGRELQRGDLKKGRKRSRTPFELAESAVQGVVPDLPLWWEYEAATKNLRSLGVSPALRERYGWDDRADEELARAEVDGEAVTTLSVRQYELVVQAGAETMVLDLAEDGGGPAVHAFLSALVAGYGPMEGRRPARRAAGA
jgi:hypothetical protein